MGMLEPSSPLWTAVKAIDDTWPPDDEVVARDLGTALGRGADTVAQGAHATSRAGADAVASWRDAAGEKFGGRVDKFALSAGQVDQSMRNVAAHAERYGRELESAKTAITSTIAANERTHAQLANPMLGATGPTLRQAHASRITTDLRKMVNQKAAAIGPAKSGVPGPPPDPKTDPGAGEHGSEPWYSRGDDMVTKELAYKAGNAAEVAGWTHAAKHLYHYLDNSGKKLTVNPDEMMRDAGQFRSEVDKTVEAEMRRITAEAETNGTYGKPVQFSTDWNGHYITKAENADWFYAMGGVQYAVTGEATVHKPDHPGGQPRVEMQYQTHVFDRYNWDGGKSTDIGPITITDDQMAEMHRAGVAQEYNITGSTETKTYDGPVPPPGQQPDLPAPPDNRDGGRTDPGR
jgi:hypothetical protein